MVTEPVPLPTMLAAGMPLPPVGTGSVPSVTDRVTVTLLGLASGWLPDRPAGLRSSAVCSVALKLVGVMTATGPSLTAVMLMVVVTGALGTSKMSLTTQVMVRLLLAPPLVGSSLVDEKTTERSTAS